MNRRFAAPTLAPERKKKNDHEINVSARIKYLQRRRVLRLHDSHTLANSNLEVEISKNRSAFPAWVFKVDALEFHNALTGWDIKSAMCRDGWYSVEELEYPCARANAPHNGGLDAIHKLGTKI